MNEQLHFVLIKNLVNCNCIFFTKFVKDGYLQENPQYLFSLDMLAHHLSFGPLE